MTTAVPTGNTYDKYGSTNPVVRRLMARFEDDMVELLEVARPASILDVGCGEGVLTEQWARAIDGRVVGIDLDDPKLQEEWEQRSLPNLEFRTGSAIAPLRGRGVRGRHGDGGPRARPRPRGGARRDGPRRVALAARERPARAALAGAQHGARRLPARARQHAGPPQPLVQAQLHAPARPQRRDGRAPVAVPWTMALVRVPVDPPGFDRPPRANRSSRKRAARGACPTGAGRRCSRR